MNIKLVVGHARTKLLTIKQLPPRYKKQAHFTAELYFLYRGELYRMVEFTKENGTLLCSKTLNEFKYNYFKYPLALKVLEEGRLIRVCRIEPRGGTKAGTAAQ